MTGALSGKALELAAQMLLVAAVPFPPVHWGKTELPPQGRGVAVYVRGESGKLAAACPRCASASASAASST